MRLDKFVCKSTELNKTAATALIERGCVIVNGVPVVNGACQVHENNRISLDGQVLKARCSRYIMINKPRNTICSNIDEVYPSLFNLLAIERVAELHVAGRLDADTTGLVLATDDGRWSFNIITPAKRCQKVYRVGLARPIAADVTAKFAQGIYLQGEPQRTLPAELTIIQPQEVLLTLTEGKFHQVKRMFSAVGNRVVSLHREQIGKLVLDVGIGEWRHLTCSEVRAFTAQTQSL